jgi:phosphoribosylformylglycinamidine synthase PurS subunit
MTWKAEVRVMLKPSVNDPQGLSIRGALHSLGFAGVQTVRAGKLMQVELEAESREEAEQQVERMCAQLLANPVIETYAFAVEEAPAAEAVPGRSPG